MTLAKSTEPAAQVRPWQRTRVTLLGLGVLATLLAIGYTVEDWRGRRAWENCKRELEAKGEVLDWAAYIPAPIPDDQNIFKAPHMAEWFVREHRDSVAKGLPWPGVNQNPESEKVPLLAEVSVVNSAASPPSGQAGLVFRFDDAAAAGRARELLLQAIGPAVDGVRGSLLVAHSLENLKTLHLTVQAATAPDVKEMSVFLLGGPLAYLDDLRLTKAGSNGFHVIVNGPVYAAADYLAWSGQLQPDFDALREALGRPLARMDGGYDAAFSRPYVNFVTIRNFAQILGQRAQCYLLLGQPEAAFRELTLIHDSCRLLDTPPAGLVAAMIKVAISGLYVEVIREGLRENAWQEAQLAGLEDQLRQMNLLATLVEAVRTEGAASVHTLDTISPSGLASLLSGGGVDSSFWERIKRREYWIFNLAPRGWIYQNTAAGAVSFRAIFENVDPTNQLVASEKINRWIIEMSASHGFPPYTILARKMTPNYSKASSTAARAQTSVNEALIACALERWKLIHHDYPETLDALAPGFLAAVPHDIIGGGALKYRRTGDGKYLLYSIGWNGKDDGGVADKARGELDWVWQAPPA